MSDKVISKLSRLQIDLICEPDEQGQKILREVQRTRASVRRQWPCPSQLGEGCDIVLCDFFPGIAQRFPWMPGEANAAVVLVLPQGPSLDFDAVHAALPDALLSRPITPNSVIPALALAWDHFSYHRRQRARIAQLDENIRSLREIERAKTILMQENNLNETNAFEALRKEAMTRRMKVSAIAKSVVDSRKEPS